MQTTALVSCLCAFVLSVYPMNASAQSYPTDQGNSLVAGSLAFSSAGGDLYAEEDNRLTTLQFNPSYSYFVSPGLAIGAKLVLARMSIGEDRQTAWGMGPQVLYFFGGKPVGNDASGETYPFIGGSFVITKQSFNDFFGEASASGTAFSFGGGISHMISNTVALFTELSYEIDNIESTSGNKINVVGGFLLIL